MYNEIIELLPSKTLKDKIQETEYKFTETELIYIIYEFAKTFEERQNLLRRFAENASNEGAKNAIMLADWQNEIYKNFREDSEGYIYELRIREEEYCEERFICSSYEAALKYIDLYYDEYKDIGVEETEKSRYHIVKRRIYSGKEDEGFSEDGCAECILGAGKIIISVDDTRIICNRHYEVENACEECGFLCPTKVDEILFPCFVKNGDIIKYTQTVYSKNDIQEQFGERHKETHYGIALVNDSEPIDYIYTMPFDSDAVKHHKYDDMARLEGHDHIYAPLAEVISIDELDEKMREDYFAYMQYWNSVGE
jgi:hypothetical protein